MVLVVVAIAQLMVILPLARTEVDPFIQQDRPRLGLATSANRPLCSASQDRLPLGGGQRPPEHNSRLFC